MPKFTFIRHGQTQANVDQITQGWRDSPLIEQGYEQARAAHHKLDLEGAVIFSSDLGRAQTTAQLVAGPEHDAKILYDWRLRERGYGELEGLPIVKEEIDRTFANSDESYRGAEPLSKFDDRIVSFLRDCSLFAADHFVVITHSGTINRLHYLLLDEFEHRHFDNGVPIELDIDLTGELPKLVVEVDEAGQ